jgi:hypothetical protein
VSTLIPVLYDFLSPSWPTLHLGDRPGEGEEGEKGPFSKAQGIQEAVEKKVRFLAIVFFFYIPLGCFL